MPESTKIEIRNIKLETLLGDMESKGIPRIPRFQRDYVWERSKVAVLPAPQTFAISGARGAVAMLWGQYEVQKAEWGLLTTKVPSCTFDERGILSLSPAKQVVCA